MRVLMVGTRSDGGVVYPVSEAALAHGAGVEEETPDAEVAYAKYPDATRGRREARGLPWETPPG